jgi:ribonuclease P protein component
LHKLKTRAHFEAALQSEVVARSEHFVLHRLRAGLRALNKGGQAEQTPQVTRRAHTAMVPGQSSGPSGVAFGVMVPKRWAVRAVTRNMIKRQARAAAHQALSGCQDEAVFLLRLRRAWPPEHFRSATSQAWASEVRQQLAQIFSSPGARAS